jgi:hypothetical protein
MSIAKFFATPVDGGGDPAQAGSWVGDIMADNAVHVREADSQIRRRAGNPGMIRAEVAPVTRMLGFTPNRSVTVHHVAGARLWKGGRCAGTS